MYVVCVCLKVRKVLDCVCGVCVSKIEKGSRLCMWCVCLKVRKVLDCVCGVCVCLKVRKVLDCVCGVCE